MSRAGLADWTMEMVSSGEIGKKKNPWKIKQLAMLRLFCVGILVVLFICLY